MAKRSNRAHVWRRSRRGMTLTETLVTTALLGLLATVTSTGIPRVTTFAQRMGTRDAAAVVASELEQVRTLAARLRVPVRVTCDCAQGTIVLTNRANGEVLRRRPITGEGPGMGVDVLEFSAAQVDVFPTGIASGPLEITLTAAGSERTVVLTSAGLVRIRP